MEVRSVSGKFLLGLKEVLDGCLSTPMQFSEYTILFVPQGEGTFHADFGAFPFNGPVLLFSTPLQMLHLDFPENKPVRILHFHSDFYCIEYHRAEVACNGLLFNNIYIQPSVNLHPDEAVVFEHLLNNMLKEFNQEAPSEIVLRAYLQLFLAKSSSVKIKNLATEAKWQEKDELMERFKELLDIHYLTLRKPQDYASLLAMPHNTFTKRCSKYFKKPPSHLITERLILEAKKQLHLTRKSVKEIAYNLNFKDEFYFSRVFKKCTNVSPQAFRDKTGISIVADLHR